MNEFTWCVLNIRNNRLVIHLLLQVIQLQAYHKAVVLVMSLLTAAWAVTA